MSIYLYVQHRGAGLGDNEQALAWLERAYKEHSMMLQYIKVHPFFDPLRGYTRFAGLGPSRRASVDSGFRRSDTLATSFL
jgi:hypothetical protein